MNMLVDIFACHFLCFLWAPQNTAKLVKLERPRSKMSTNAFVHVILARLRFVSYKLNFLASVSFLFNQDDSNYRCTDGSRMGVKINGHCSKIFLK